MYSLIPNTNHIREPTFFNWIGKKKALKCNTYIVITSCVPHIRLTDMHFNICTEFYGCSYNSQIVKSWRYRVPPSCLFMSLCQLTIINTNACVNFHEILSMLSASKIPEKNVKVWHLKQQPSSYQKSLQFYISHVLILFR